MEENEEDEKEEVIEIEEAETYDSSEDDEDLNDKGHKKFGGREPRKHYVLKRRHSNSSFSSTVYDDIRHYFSSFWTLLLVTLNE